MILDRESMKSKGLEWQNKSKLKNISADEFEEIRRLSVIEAEKKRKDEEINANLQKIPARFRNKSFVDYEAESLGQQKCKNLIERYVNTFEDRLKSGTSLVFMGNPGTGKTLLSLIMFRSLLKSGFLVHYESSLEFIKNLLEVKFKSQSEFIRRMDLFKRPQLLIIDEATESINKNGVPSDIDKQILFQIINHRYADNLCTLIITNRDLPDLKFRLGEPLVDRLSEKGVFIAFNWESYRKK
jgi:DNA replication protein DnaC